METKTITSQKQADELIAVLVAVEKMPMMLEIFNQEYGPRLHAWYQSRIAAGEGVHKYGKMHLFNEKQATVCVSKGVVTAKSSGKQSKLDLNDPAPPAGMEETEEDRDFYRLCCRLTGFVEGPPAPIEPGNERWWWNFVTDEELIVASEGRWTKDEIDALWVRANALSQPCSVQYRESFLRRCDLNMVTPLPFLDEARRVK